MHSILRLFHVAPGYSVHSHLQLFHCFATYLVLSLSIVFLFSGTEQCTAEQSLVASLTSAVCCSLVVMVGRNIFGWAYLGKGPLREAYSRNMNDRARLLIGAQLSRKVQSEHAKKRSREAAQTRKANAAAARASVLAEGSAPSAAVGEDSTKALTSNGASSSSARDDLGDISVRVGEGAAGAAGTCPPGEDALSAPSFTEGGEAFSARSFSAALGSLRSYRAAAETAQG